MGQKDISSLVEVCRLQGSPPQKSLLRFIVIGLLVIAIA